jgi:hypothetical protein
VSEYHKIETLYERDEKSFKVRPGEFKNRVYSILKSWHWTEKVDGTNIRLIWNPATGLTFGGKTDNAQIPADLVNWLREHVTEEMLRAVFPDTEAVIYCEGYGAGIQKGGDYSPTKKVIVFDVLAGGKWWLSDENMRDVATKFGLEAVPSFGEMTIEDATALVRAGFKSRCAVTERPAEGLVGRPIEALFDKKGARLIVKLKTKDFA